MPNVSAEVEVEANRYLPDEGQQVPEQVAEIALSPTPMLWEDGDASTGVKNDEDDPAPATEKKRKPIPGWPKAILPEELLPGQVAHIKETREIYMYATEGKTICGEVQREYQVVYLKPVKARKPMEDTPTAQQESWTRRLIRGDTAGDVVAGSPMTKEDLVQAMEEKVTSITETSSRSVYMYHNNKKLTKDKTTRTFEVDFLSWSDKGALDLPSQEEPVKLGISGFCPRWSVPENPPCTHDYPPCTGGIFNFSDHYPFSNFLN